MSHHHVFTLLAAVIVTLSAACSSQATPRFVDNDDCSEVSREPLPETTASLHFTEGESVNVDAEVASTPSSQGQGLMCRPEVPGGTGMLFVFEAERSGAFWMYNTYVDLDIIYIRPDGTIADIKRMNSCLREGQSDNEWASRCGRESAAYQPDQSYTATLELPAGWLNSDTPGTEHLARVTWQ